LKFSARNPGTVRVSTENSKAAVILARCAILGPATAVFRLTRLNHETKPSKLNYTQNPLPDRRRIDLLSRIEQIPRI
jgi:hypothetical protein